MGFGLPLAGADVENILVIDEEVDVSRGAATVGLVSGYRAASASRRPCNSVVLLSSVPDIDAEAATGV